MVQEFCLPRSMRYAALAFRTISLLDLMSSSGISVIRRVIISTKMFWDCGGFGEWVVNSVADPGEGPAHLIFRQNWGPKGKKKVFGDPSPHYLRVWMTGAPPPKPRALDLAMQLVCESVETVFRWSSLKFKSSQVNFYLNSHRILINTNQRL